MTKNPYPVMSEDREAKERVRMEEIRTLTEQLTAVRLDVARLETKLEAVQDLSKRAGELDDVAKEALQSTRSSHKRLDDLKGSELKTLADNQTWLWRTVLAAFLAGLINLLWKGIGS